MPVSVVFVCEICGARPDPGTQVALERQLLDLRHGEYVDAEPGRWLTWHGRGMFWFSLGRSTIVFALALLLSIGIKSLDRQVAHRGSSLHDVTG